MFSAINNHIVTATFCLLFALHLFNISVDIPDEHHEFHVENLSYNDQESIVEFFVEKILGYENAFEEKDDVDHEDESSTVNAFHFFLDTDHLNVAPALISKSITRTLFYYPFHKWNKPYLEVPSPPPDRV